MSSPTVTFSDTAALPDWSAFTHNSYLARVDWPSISVVVKLPDGARQKPTSFWRETVLSAAGNGYIEGKRVVEVTEWPKPVLWRDIRGRAVDVENIDKVYALNILMMHTARKARMGWTPEDFKRDELTQKLRETVLHGREPNADDDDRAREYNERCRRHGVSLRAPITQAQQETIDHFRGKYGS